VDPNIGFIADTINPTIRLVLKDYYGRSERIAYATSLFGTGVKPPEANIRCSIGWLNKTLNFEEIPHEIRIDKGSEYSFFFLQLTVLHLVEYPMARIRFLNICTHPLGFIRYDGGSFIFDENTGKSICSSKSLFLPWLSFHHSHHLLLLS